MPAPSGEDEAFGHQNIGFLPEIVAQMLHPYTTCKQDESIEVESVKFRRCCAAVKYLKCADFLSGDPEYRFGFPGYLIPLFPSAEGFES